MKNKITFDLEETPRPRARVLQPPSDQHNRIQFLEEMREENRKPLEEPSQDSEGRIDVTAEREDPSKPPVEVASLMKLNMTSYTETPEAQAKEEKR
jgi:hypothetical protein